MFGKLSILTKSRIYNLGKIIFSLVQFQLVRFSVQITRRLWYKPSHGFLGTNVICIGYSDIIALVVQ